MDPAQGLVVSPVHDDRMLRPGAARLPAPPALFVVDVDGTLLTSMHEVSPATVREVRRVRARGIEVLLASSRGAGAMRPVVEALGLTDGTVFVGSQGGLTAGYDGDGALRVLDRCPVPLAAARAVVTAATAEGLAVGWYAGARWLVSHVDPTIEREARVVHDTPQVADLLTESTEPDKLLVIAPPGGDPEVLRRLAAALPAQLTAQISNPTYLEVTCRGVDKASAVSRRCAARGIPLDAVVAIGDGPNDLGLFAVAGTSVAPANARPEVAAAATWTTRANDDDGLAWALSVLVPAASEKRREPARPAVTRPGRPGTRPHDD